MAKITLSKEQNHIIDTLLEWYFKTGGDSITLGGYAGTGKSTLISHLRKTLALEKKKLKVAFCCYTGKAAWNLRKKLEETSSIYYTDTCSTIHSLIYEPLTDDKDRIVSWLKRDLIEYDLIIIDEASMVDEEIWADISSYGIPIIAVGDHGQLPPIGTHFNLMKTPDLILEKIHRQAQNNPIIQLSIKARESSAIAVGEYGDHVIKFSKNNPQTAKFLEQIYTSFNDQTLILCATNNKRIELNKTIRKALGFKGKLPQVDERVICLKNNKLSQECPVFNGMMGRIKDIEPKGKHWYKAQILMDGEPNPYIGRISSHFFDNPKGELPKNVRLGPMDIGDMFDRGYAITVHKAQGSEFDRVVVFEENLRGCDKKKWIYTAITRAKKELYIISQ